MKRAWLLYNLNAKLMPMVVALIVFGSTASPALAAPVKNIVLVHGAWVGGSGWKPVYEILTKDGYHVSVVQEPLTSLEADVAATKRVLDLQTGPCILVAHSYGGTIIPEAGNDPHVVGLVYIAAYEPDTGETEASNGKLFPSATSKTKAIEKTPDGFTFLNPDLERMYATRAHSHKVEVEGASHSVYESHPREVAALIEEAAQQSQN